MMTLDVHRAFAIEFIGLAVGQQSIPATTNQFSNIKPAHSLKGLVGIDDFSNGFARIHDDGRNRRQVKGLPEYASVQVKHRLATPANWMDGL